MRPGVNGGAVGGRLNGPLSEYSETMYYIHTAGYMGRVLIGRHKMTAVTENAQTDSHRKFSDPWD